jgi:hypothetical protein
MAFQCNKIRSVLSKSVKSLAGFRPGGIASPLCVNRGGILEVPGTAAMKCPEFADQSHGGPGALEAQGTARASDAVGE